MPSSGHGEIGCSLCGWTQLICLCGPGTDHFTDDRLTLERRPSGRGMRVRRDEDAEAITALTTRLTGRLADISEVQHRLARERTILAEALRRLRVGESPVVVEAQIASQLKFEVASHAQ
jgi:hypothetical protein